MKYLVGKDKKYRQVLFVKEKKKLLLRCIVKNKFLSTTVREFAAKLLTTFRISKSNVRNFCIVTARPRGVIKKFNISRMCFKRFASFGYLKSIKKASW